MGVTGDLAKNKLLPALADLSVKNLLPKDFRIVGFSRREMSPDEYSNFVKESLDKKQKYSDKQISDFIERTEYVRGDFSSLESFKNLKARVTEIDNERGVCGNKMIYLSVPPSLYETLFENISKSGLSKPCGGENDWARILVEKPFGNNTETAKKLEEKLSANFKEEQIFRIDHYLAKEVLQNILTFRFSNTMFEPLWNKKHIKSVHIHFFESGDVSKRGTFYDSIGALRDVGQNHMLQMLALIAMEKPKNFICADIRKERAKALSKLKINGSEFLRGRYVGYTSEDGVSPESQTETFFSLKTYVDNSRWKNVPFFLVSGKALKESRVEIKIRFIDPDPSSVLPIEYPDQEQNTLTFRIQPHEGIGLLFWFRVPGFGSKIEPQTLKFNYADSESSRVIPDAYEKVLYDCISGDQTLFASSKEVEFSWKYITKIMDLWKNSPMIEYEKGSDPFSIGKQKK